MFCLVLNSFYQFFYNPCSSYAKLGILWLYLDMYLGKIKAMFVYISKYFLLFCFQSLYLLSFSTHFQQLENHPD